VASPNESQIAHWNRDAGPVWVRFQERLDAQIEAHGALALEALAPAPGERILDVGCGCGTTSLELARRVGAKGEVLGLDISAPMLARAEERACEAGLTNVRFQQGDAQVAPLPPEHFDAVFSRFGVMFFEEPEPAFANLHRALRPGGRLAFVSWQAPDRNPWVVVPMAAAAPLLEMPPPPAPGSPGMFGLADPERVRRVLDGAGFADVAVRGEQVAMRPGGGDVDEAARTFLEVGPVAGLLREQGAGPELRARVEEAVRDAFAAARGEEGLALGSAVWIVTARRA
jgi:SAM-dependent methyltransferase